jgi:hypothetical protein
MPSPGDSNNLKPNLTTLANLTTSPAGSKLSYNPTSERFSIDGAGLFQPLMRRYGGTPLPKRSTLESLSANHPYAALGIFVCLDATGPNFALC